MPRIEVTHFTDPGCPWAYSVRPAHAALRWRYGAQLVWRRVLIGLAEDPAQYVARGYTPQRMSQTRVSFRRFGMPYGGPVKDRIGATSLGCRVVVAARLHAPADEELVFRTLQVATFTAAVQLDDPERLRAALAPIGHEGLVALAADDAEVRAAYEADRAEARTAAGSPTEFQGKHAQTDGPVRYTAPSLVFRAEDGRTLEAGGWQSIEAYDVCIANLDRSLSRRDPPADPVEVLAEFGEGMSTEEVAQVLRRGDDAVDRTGTERLLLAAAAVGRVRFDPAGDDATWFAAPAAVAAPAR